MATQYLKEAHRLVVAWMAKTPEIAAPREAAVVLVKRDSKGLPTIIPTYLRKLILQRDVRVIRLVLSILGLYRVIRAPMNLKLRTITDPGPDMDPQVRSEVLGVMGLFFGHVRKYNSKFSWLFSVSAGPNQKHATRGSPYDAAAMLLEPKVLGAFSAMAPWYVTAYMVVLGVFTYPIIVMNNEWKRILPDGSVGGMPNHFQTARGDYRPLCLGRLAVKLEAAGKARVFAITDWWTQGLLFGLHQFLFSILKQIDQDGTFDQTRPLQVLKDHVRLGGKVYSYDLSAATDRLPVSIQIWVLHTFTGYQYAESWKTLLVSRYWHQTGGLPLLYGAGQPMGAYSSWAILALTHHVLVQVAAARAGWKEWFPFYALLGDDVVIAHEGVANEYYSLITHLGVEINLSKSIISEGGLIEFAKRLESPFVDYSPVSAKGLLAAFRNGLLLPALYRDMVSKNWQILPYQILETLQDVIPYYPKGAGQANAYVGFVATLGPTGPSSLTLADWIAMRISPVHSKDWIGPGLSSAVSWVISSSIRAERDSASLQVRRSLVDFLGLKVLQSLYDIWRTHFWDWHRIWNDRYQPMETIKGPRAFGGQVAAPGSLARFAILTPGFWVYTRSLFKLALGDITRVSRQSVELTSAEAVRDFLAKPWVDWGPLFEAANPHLSTLKSADLRLKILKAQKMWSPDSLPRYLSPTVMPDQGEPSRSEDSENSAPPGRKA